MRNLTYRTLVLSQVLPWKLGDNASSVAKPLVPSGNKASEGVALKSHLGNSQGHPALTTPMPCGVHNVGSV